MPNCPRPSIGALATGLLLSACFQLSIVGLLFGSVCATGHPLTPIALVGAFGVSQIAGAVPGPNGASPRDGALVVSLVALGMPWIAAAGAVTLTATIAWLPALTLGGSSLFANRRSVSLVAT